MEDNKKGTRKRIVRKASEGHAEKVDYSTSRSYSSDRPAYGERRGGERRPYGEHRDGERRSFGERRDGERRPYGERRSYGEHQDGERRPYGEHRDGERRSFTGGEHKAYGDRKPFGERKGGYGKPGPRGGAPRKPYGAAKRNPADEGMSAMLSRKPQVNGRYSDDDTAKPEIQEVVRLNKFIANSGVCSRREADTLIQSGVVTVNGEVVTELGTKVNILTDDVRFNGQRLKGEEKVYIVMNKPKGYVTTSSDPHAGKTVMDLLKNCETRVFPVGRLDKATTGVLMFTNDGEIAERLTHPSYDKKKIYQVILDRELSQEDYDKVLAGVELSDGEVSADELEYIDATDHRRLGIEIHSGKNRIVRRIFESLGYSVKALDRVYFAGLTKKGLTKGEWRYLTEGEVNVLKMGAYV
jgi:23S rRNA pseudouridine2605 synthase